MEDQEFDKIPGGWPRIGTATFEAGPNQDRNPANTDPQVNFRLYEALQQFHNELVYARRTILVVIQMLFSHQFQRGQLQHHFIGPITTDHHFNIKYWEDFSINEWETELIEAMNTIGHMIQQQHPPGLGGINLPWLWAQYIYVAIQTVNYILLLAGQLDNLVSKYRVVAFWRLSHLEPNDPTINLINQFNGLINKLVDDIVKLNDERNQLIRAVAKLQSSKLEQINRVQPDPIHLELTRIYYRLHPTPGQVPIDMFVDLAYKVFGWNWRRAQTPGPDGRLVLHAPLEGVIVIRAAGEPEELEGFTFENHNPLAEYYVFNRTVYEMLQRMRCELIYARRFILAVMEMTVGDWRPGRLANQQQWVQLADPNNYQTKYEIEAMENMALRDWNRNVMAVVYNRLEQSSMCNLINEHPAVGQHEVPKVTYDEVLDEDIDPVVRHHVGPRGIGPDNILPDELPDVVYRQRTLQLLQMALGYLKYIQYVIIDAGLPLCRNYHWCSEFRIHYRQQYVSAQHHNESVEMLYEFNRQMLHFGEVVGIHLIQKHVDLLNYVIKNYLLHQFEPQFRFKRRKALFSQLEMKLSEIYFDLSQAAFQVPLQQFADISKRLFDYDWESYYIDELGLLPVELLHEPGETIVVPDGVFLLAQATGPGAEAGGGGIG